MPENQEQEHRYEVIEVPEKPGYEREFDENIDAALEDALETVRMGDEEYLQRLLAAELGSFRYSRGRDM